MTTVRARVWIALLAGTLPSLAVPLSHADSDEVTALRQQVTELQRSVEHLNARVETLERQRAVRSQSGAGETAVPPVGGRDTAATAAHEPGVRDHWRSLAHGMTQQQVETLLGRPDRTMRVDAKTLWYYSYEDVGNGSVVFSQDGDVIDWQTPPFNTWW